MAFLNLGWLADIQISISLTVCSLHNAAGCAVQTQEALHVYKDATHIASPARVASVIKHRGPWTAA